MPLPLHDRSRPLSAGSGIVASIGTDDTGISMAWHPLLALVLAATVVMGSPGPATISVTAVAAAFGARRSLPYLCGIILGTTVVLLAVATGIVAMLLSVPQIAPVLIAASAAYILYLAYRIATAPPLTQARSRTLCALPRRRVGCWPSPIPRPTWRSPRSSQARRLPTRSARHACEDGGACRHDRRHPRLLAAGRHVVQARALRSR